MSLDGARRRVALAQQQLLVALLDGEPIEGFDHARSRRVSRGLATKHFEHLVRHLPVTWSTSEAIVRQVWEGRDIGDGSDLTLAELAQMLLPLVDLGPGGSVELALAASPLRGGIRRRRVRVGRRSVTWWDVGSRRRRVRVR